MAELRIDASLLAANITRVTMTAEQSTAELELNPVTGTFDGALVLTAGTHAIVARAFADDVLVGESRPTSVVIEIGVVTRVQIKILDVSNQTSTYGPIIDSLTFPTTAEVGTAVELTLAAVAPDGSPLSYAWSSDCPDSIFSAPAAPVTTWSNPTEGACRIHAAATASGITVDSVFSIVVFPQGALSGAVDASGEFVAAPVLRFSSRALACNLTNGDNASCTNAIASPTVTDFTVDVVSWGGSPPGSLTVTQNCGGRFVPEPDRPFDTVTGHWLPAVDRGVCIFTARAENRDGAVAILAPAILVRAGVPPTITPPTISAQLESSRPCIFTNTNSPVDCGTATAGNFLFLDLSLSWAAGTPGPGSISDDCGGVMIAMPSFIVSRSTEWRLPLTPGRLCTTTIHSTTIEGGESVAIAQYRLR